MRVAIVGPEAADSLEFNLRYCLTGMGHDAKVFNESTASPLLRLPHARRFLPHLVKMSPAFHRSLATRIARQVIDHEPELVIVTERNLHAAFGDTLRDTRNRPRVAHLNPDALTTFGRGYLFMTGYDAYFTKDRYIQRFMRNQLGLEAHYLPEAFNPGYHAKPDLPKEEAESRVGIDVMVMGNLYPYRTAFIDRLLAAGIDVTVFGRRFNFVSGAWKDHFTGEYVTGTRKAELVHGSKIVLNNMHYAEIDSVNCKFFEILGCGGFQLCNNQSVVPELAEPGREVEVFDSLDGAIRKIRQYLDDVRSRHAIAEAGYIRALRDHTYEKRIQEMMDILESLPRKAD